MKLVFKIDWLQVWDDVLSEEYCKKIVDIQKKELFNQPLVDPISEESKEANKHRTSMQSFIKKDSNLDKDINEKTYKLTNIPIENYEETSVIRYKEGQEYKLHNDYFFPERTWSPDSFNDESDYEIAMSEGGNRISTALFILDGNCEGGETYFPRLNNLLIKPKTGRVIIWQNIFSFKKINYPFYNEFENTKYTLNEKSQHAGRPVISGEKWIATKWIRESKWKPNIK